MILLYRATTLVRSVGWFQQVKVSPRLPTVGEFLYAMVFRMCSWGMLYCCAVRQLCQHTHPHAGNGVEKTGTDIRLALHCRGTFEDVHKNLRFQASINRETNV